MKDIFQQWPAVEIAYAHIRKSRSEAYFAVWEQFSRAWSKALGIPQDIAILSGPSLGAAIDTLFETEDVVRHGLLVEELLEATQPDEALKILRQSPAHIKEATRVLLAFLTVEGLSQAKLASDPDLKRHWLDAWSRTVRTHAEQQVDLERTARQQDVSLAGASFDQAVEQYLHRFAYTMTFPTTLMATLAWWPWVSVPLIQEFMGLSKQLGEFLRLVSDAVYSPSEKINVGLFTVAATQQTSLPEAHRRVLEHKQTTPLALQLQVANAANQRRGLMARDFDQLLARYAAQPCHKPLEAFSQVILGASKKMIDVGLAGESHPHAS